MEEVWSATLKEIFHWRRNKTTYKNAHHYSPDTCYVSTTAWHVTIPCGTEFIFCFLTLLPYLNMRPHNKMNCHYSLANSITEYVTCLLIVYTHSTVSDIPGNNLQKFLLHHHYSVLNVFNLFVIKLFKNRSLVSGTWKYGEYGGCSDINICLLTKSPLTKSFLREGTHSICTAVSVLRSDGGLCLWRTNGIVVRLWMVSRRGTLEGK
jgi:hypothetical protein